MKTYEDYKINLEGKTGSQIRVLCPECSGERKKNNLKELAVNTTLGTWFCHHCGWKGGLVGTGKTYKIPEYTAKTKLPAKVISYFKERGISELTLESNKIGYGPVWMPAVNKEVNAIQFPFYKNGVVINIKYRDGQKNFRQAKDAEKCFYGFDNMSGTSKVLIITEGEIDTLSFLEIGFTDVVSIPDGAPPANANNYTTKFDFLKSAEEKISKYKRVILAVDSDSSGKRAEEELARRIGCERCYKVKYPDDCKDANETLKKHGRKVLKDVIENAKAFPISGLFTATDFINRVEAIYDNGIERGSMTGWSGLDKFYTVKCGELTVITGIPGSGKSNFLDSLMLNLIESGNWKFGVFSPENWPIERHIQTLSEKITGDCFFESYYRGYERMDRSMIAKISKHLDENIYFIQPPEDEEPTIDKIMNLAKIALFRNGINALIIDPWNEVSHDFGNMTETQYISKELGRLRRFGRLNGIHIFIVAHPKNLQKGADGKYNPPSMYDISGGAHWRNKADNGICVHRSYDKETKNDVEIFIQKIRFREIGKIGKRTLRFEPATARYYDDIKQDDYEN